MKQFGKILKFELNNYFTNKIFVGVTLFLVAALAVVMFSARIFGGEGESEMKPSESQEETQRDVLLLSGSLAQTVKEAFSEAFPAYEVQVFEEDMEALREEVISGRADCAFVFDSLTSYTYYVDDLEMYDINTDIADEVLQELSRVQAMLSAGMSQSEIESVMNMQIEHETSSLGKDQRQNFFYTYIMIFALYMVILLYGQMIATNVATEKSSRAMELLITSARPVSMMFGKVIASCIAGLTQMIAVFGSALLFYNLNKTQWAEHEIMASIFDMPVGLFGYMLVFFVLGFLIYAFLFGAVGSTASKLEDINTSVMPVTFLFIIGFMVVMFSLGSGSVDTVLMKICSFVPFTSPMAMFTRLAMSSVPVYEVLLSIVLLIASVIGIGVLSAKIYRVGVLLYGTTPSVKAIWKAVKNSNLQN